MLHLYHHHSSVCAAKVRVALAEKSLDWHGTELTLQGDQLRPAYRALNPAAVVPTLVHDDAVVTESNVILEYLEDAFRSVPLRPVSAADTATMRLLLQRLDGADGIHAAASVLTYAVAWRHRLIAEAGGLAPERMEPVLARRMKPASHELLSEAIYRGIHAQSFRQALDTVDGMLAALDARLRISEWLAGPRYSVADVAYTPYLARFALLGLAPLIDRSPRVSRWYRLVCQRESATEVFERYRLEDRDLLAKQSHLLQSQLPDLLDNRRPTS